MHVFQTFTRLIVKSRRHSPSLVVWTMGVGVQELQEDGDVLQLMTNRGWVYPRRFHLSRLIQATTRGWLEGTIRKKLKALSVFWSESPLHLMHKRGRVMRVRLLLKKNRKRNYYNGIITREQ